MEETLEKKHQFRDVNYGTLKSNLGNCSHHQLSASESFIKIVAAVPEFRWNKQSD